MATITLEAWQLLADDISSSMESFKHLVTEELSSLYKLTKRGNNCDDIRN